MKLLPHVLFIICVFSLSANAQRFTVEEIKSVSDNGVTTTFPVFHSKDIGVDNKINTLLQQTEYQVNDEMKFQYEVKLNTSKILTVAFAKEDCRRSFCEEFFTHYNFDARTGELINIDKLFTEKGLEQVKTSIYEVRRKSVNGLLRKARDTDNKEAFSLYQECLETIDRNDVLIGGFYLEDDKIHFVRFPCSAYMQREIDEIGTFDDTMTIKSLRKSLSAYGKDLTK